jgi:hypothetical protein
VVLRRMSAEQIVELWKKWFRRNKCLEFLDVITMVSLY